MIDRGGEAGEIGRRSLGPSNELFRRWHRARDGTMARSALKGDTDPSRRAARQDLRLGAECSCATTAATCRGPLGGEEHLWTSLRVAGGDPTNNATGRALRHAAIGRRLGQATESGSGRLVVERLLSVVATCRQQGRAVLDDLIACQGARLLGHPAPSLLPEGAADIVAA